MPTPRTFWAGVPSASPNAGLMPNLLAFDGSVQGERLPRYEASCSRTTLRTLAEFDKMHKANDETVRELPPNGNGVSPGTIIDVGRDFEIDSLVPDALCTQSIDASAPIAYNEIPQPTEAVDLGMPSSSERATIHRSQELPKKTIAATTQELPTEPTDLTVQNAEPDEAIYRARVQLRHSATLGTYTACGLNSDISRPWGPKERLCFREPY